MSLPGWAQTAITMWDLQVALALESNATLLSQLSVPLFGAQFGSEAGGGGGDRNGEGPGAGD